MSEKKTDFSYKSRLIFESKEYVQEVWVFLFRGFFVKNQLWDNIDWPLHLSLCFDEKMEMVFLCMDEAFFKSLWIHKANKRAGTFPNGVSEETGLIRIRKPAVFEEIGKVEFYDPYEL